MTYDWHFERLAPYTNAFIAGAVTTVFLTLLVSFFGTALGVSWGFGLRNRTVALTTRPVVEVVKAVPPLVLLLFFYYLLSQQIIGTAVQAFWVYVIAMSINLGAFTADLVHAAIVSVDRETTDPARALGLSERQITRHIYLPRVTQSVIPAMSTLYIAMLKTSSLASIINVGEVVYTAETVIADIARSLEAWTVVAAIYVVLVVPISIGLRHLSLRLSRNANVGLSP